MIGQVSCVGVLLQLCCLQSQAVVGQFLIQVPLGALTSFRFMQGQLGNVIVWTSIVLGQPIAILMYLHDYYWIHWAPLIQNGTEAAA